MSSWLVPPSSLHPGSGHFALGGEGCGRPREQSNSSSTLHQSLSQKQKARSLENLVKELFTMARAEFRKTDRA